MGAGSFHVRGSPCCARSAAELHAAMGMRASRTRVGSCQAARLWVGETDPGSHHVIDEGSAMNASQAVDRVAGLVRSATRQADRVVRRVASAAGGKAKGLGNRETAKADMDDLTLKSKVESEIFRPADAPNSTVNVNVVDGVVELRGEVKNPDAKQNLEDKARSIPEVREVRNLLHLPKTPAPGRADSPGRQRAKSP